MEANYNQQPLFNSLESDSLDGPQVVVREPIAGLTVLPEFISQVDETRLLQTVTKQKWLQDLSRRVQHYGYKYDYKSRRIDASMKLGPMPHWISEVLAKLVARGYFSKTPDQMIVNEYLPGQGIAPHVDCEPCFEDTIASLSLGSGTVMNFHQKSRKTEVYLPPRSIVVLKGESRYEWKHSIPKRKSDVIHGNRVKRTTRVSLTFRRVIL